MEIGFDAKRAAQNATGLGNYSRFILTLLVRYGKGVGLHLYVPDKKKAGLLQRLPASKTIHTEYPKGLVDSLLPSVWRSWGMTAQVVADDVQVYHGLSGELPLNIRKAKRVRKVVTIHDLLFLRFPQGYHILDRLIYNYKFRCACRNADRIIAVSEFTKRDVMNYYHIPEEKISVVYQSCDASFLLPATAESKATVRKAYDLTHPYILYVGSIEKRKNLLLLAKAIGKVPAGVNVFAVGRRTPYADEVEEYLRVHGLSERMRLQSGVPFEHLPALYQMAELFVYPSRCEGFGIPMLEALCSGTPAIGCTGSCLEEAGGPDSVYVDPDDDAALARNINSILNDPLRREKMVSNGRKFALRFEEKKLFDDLMRVYTD